MRGTEIENLLYGRWLELINNGHVERVGKSAQELSQSQTYDRVKLTCNKIADLCRRGDLDAARALLVQQTTPQGQSR